MSPLHANTFAESKRSTFVLLFFVAQSIRAKRECSAAFLKLP